MEKAGERLDRKENQPVRQKAGVQSLRSQLMVLPTAMKPVWNGLSAEPLGEPRPATA